MAQTNFNFWGPTQVLFGPGRLNDLHTLPMPGKKAMVVISNGKSTRANGYLDRTLDQLAQTGVESVVFDKVGANPTKEVTEEGAFFARENGVDFIVALGGGSIMDCSKVIALFAPQPSDDLWDYAGGKTGKGKAPENPELPWIAITTTAGTGSEVDSAGVISNEQTHEKIGIGSATDFARYAIVDPELMLSVPPKFTAYQGFDALFHSLEGYISKPTNPFAEMVQRAAIENIGTWLPVAVADGNNVEARTHVAFANTMSGYSMCTSACTSEHSMEHAMSAYHPALPHGAGLIMISRAYFQFWVDKHIIDDRFVDMAKFLGKEDATCAQDFITALVDLQRACGVDDLKMSDYGIKKEEAMTLAVNSRETMGGLYLADPAETTNEEIAGIYEAAWK